MMTILRASAMIYSHPQLTLGNFMKTWINLNGVNYDEMDTVEAVGVGYFALGLGGMVVA